MSCADEDVVLVVVVLAGAVAVLEVVVALDIVVLDVVVVDVVLAPPATIATFPIVTAGDGGLQTIGSGPTLPPLAFRPDTDATRPFPVVV